MAYANLIAQSCNNPIETFLRFRDFMCKRNGTYDYSVSGVGWTLYDSVYAVDQHTISFNDYFVMYSAGEDGLRDMYYQVQYVSGFIKIIGYLYWNTSTHTGVHGYGTTNTWTNTLATNNILWVYADLDMFIGISKYTATYYHGEGGWMPDSSISQDITVAAGAITAGSNVTVTFPAVPGSWVEGTKLFVKDTANVERVIITAISGLDVTFSAFVASYLAGSKFSLELTSYAVCDVGSYYLQMSHLGTKNVGAAQDNPGILNPTTGDGITGFYPAKKIYVSGTSTFNGPLKNILSTVSAFSSETTHTDGTTSYRYFNLYSIRYMLIKEV